MEKRKFDKELLDLCLARDGPLVDAV